MVVVVFIISNMDEFVFILGCMPFRYMLESRWFLYFYTSLGLPVFIVVLVVLLHCTAVRLTNTRNIVFILKILCLT